MRAEIRKVKALTDKSFGVPFMLSYDLSLIAPMVDLLIDEKVPVVLDNGWLDPAIYAKLKTAGIKIICRLPNPNLPDALKAQELGADILVLTGFDEGGTLPMKEVGSFSVLAEFIGKVDLPIMLAGGIGDKKGVQAALNWGQKVCGLAQRLSPQLSAEAIKKSKNGLLIVLPMICYCFAPSRIITAHCPPHHLPKSVLN